MSGNVAQSKLVHMELCQIRTASQDLPTSRRLFPLTILKTLCINFLLQPVVVTGGVWFNRATSHQSHCDRRQKRNLHSCLSKEFPSQPSIRQWTLRSYQSIYFACWEGIISSAKYINCKIELNEFHKEW